MKSIWQFVDDLTNCRDDCREGVRGCHIYLMKINISRQSLFVLFYALHLLIPLFGLVVFVCLPCVRAAIIFAVCITIIIQLASRTCPIVKIENALMPEASKITWSTAKYLKPFGIIVSNTTRFWWMIVCTICAVMTLITIHFFLPEGLDSMRKWNDVAVTIYDNYGRHISNIVMPPKPNMETNGAQFNHKKPVNAKSKKGQDVKINDANSLHAAAGLLPIDEMRDLLNE